MGEWIHSFNHSGHLRVDRKNIQEKKQTSSKHLNSHPSCSSGLLCSVADKSPFKGINFTKEMVICVLSFLQFCGSVHLIHLQYYHSNCFSWVWRKKICNFVFSCFLGGFLYSLSIFQNFTIPNQTKPKPSNKGPPVIHTLELMSDRARYFDVKSISALRRSSILGWLMGELKLMQKR